ncbi:accessory Sec system protein Asp1 [Candidatus Enterococcus murrayae]|uniref:Accessory Sec system protein Asp1 n=1 Tax=Candidatus Enterococcus murrayae TaxID=2815321 RepID=A0ABS3HGL1_9ENTE|nr:accessory Sec system protein Asp1 [Enterococcus sp. MJM16]MBO0452055.1 accessory Sec system protein Asp1 [Enterococcus sp. MJM16]
MMYLIPNWEQNDNSLENDRILNITKLFTENGEPYKLFLLNHLPFLRYKAQEHSLLSDCYWRAYDVIQNITIQEGHPLGLEDLSLPKDVEHVYTPFGIILFQKNKKFGEIKFNKYGCIEGVKYFKEDYDYFEYYDDRGFLSLIEYLTKQNIVTKREYFNEYGEKTITELLKGNSQIIVEEAGADSLKSKTFCTIDEVIAEVLKEELKQIKDQNKQIITTTDNAILNVTQEIQEDGQLVRIVSDDDVLNQYDKHLFIKSLKTAKCVVTDTKAKMQELLTIKKANPELADVKIATIPMFNTELALGMSNSIAQLIIYWKVEQLSDFQLAANQIFMNNLIENTKYSLIVEVRTRLDQRKLQEAQKELIDSYFDVDSESEDFKKTAHFIEAKRIKRLYKADELAIEEIRKSAAWKNLVKAINVYNRIEFRVQPTLLSVRNDFHKTRLYVDINEKYNLQMQSLAISAGIPQLAKVKTDFIEEKKNGMIVRRTSELEPALTFFLQDLSNWNNALVKNVSVIEDFSPQIILKKWREVLNG